MSAAGQGSTLQLRPKGALPGAAWTVPFERAYGFLAREAPLIGVWGLMTALWLYVAGGFAADSWLALLGGREIAAHGLPHHDSFAIISHGREWVDQQWLAQLFFYGLYALGGADLVSRANVVLFALAGALALVAARRSGASPSRVAVCAVPAMLLTATFVRAQVLSQVLFVCLLVLLERESRRPSLLVFLAFPLLVLWANLHGAVVVGAGAVALLGAVELGRALVARTHRGVGRAAFLILAPWPCLLASPYGVELVRYYRATFANPVFARYITEWKHPTLFSLWGSAFALTALFTAAVVWRRRADLNAFELGILAMTFAGGAMAVRSIIWFVYAVVMLVPARLERLWPAAPLRDRSLPARAAVSTVALLACVVAAVKPSGGMATEWPAAAGRTVAAAAARDPSLRVFSNEEYADWLLFEHPSLRGRLAYDGRWEILSAAQMTSVMQFLHHQTASWERPARGYRLIVLDPKTNRRLVRTYEGRPGVRVLYRDRRVVVFERP